MKRRSMPVYGLEEAVGPWYLNEVVGWAIEGLVAADAKIRPRRLDQRLRLGKDEPFGDWRWRERNIFGQAFALIGRKDSEALEEWNGAGLPILLCRSLTFFAGREAVGINDGSAMCSLANIPAERQRLPEGQKTVRAEAILDDS